MRLSDWGKPLQDQVYFMVMAARIIHRPDFDSALISKAFALYSRYYAPVDLAVFTADFLAKSWAVVLQDRAGKLCGFSTVERFWHQTPDGPVQVLFSGDTVIDQAHWGEQVLPFAWVEQAGRIKDAAPLYWLLITKGHRTYRYLPAFTHQYFPNAAAPFPPQCNR